jgi:hypothetical protein
VVDEGKSKLARKSSKPARKEQVNEQRNNDDVTDLDRNISKYDFSGVPVGNVDAYNETKSGEHQKSGVIVTSPTYMGLKSLTVRPGSTPIFLSA